MYYTSLSELKIRYFFNKIRTTTHAKSLIINILRFNRYVLKFSYLIINMLYLTLESMGYIDYRCNARRITFVIC